jgi:hypothetical protein
LASAIASSRVISFTVTAPPSPAEPRVRVWLTCLAGAAPWASRPPSRAEPRVRVWLTCLAGAAPWASRPPSRAEPRVRPRLTCPDRIAWRNWPPPAGMCRRVGWGAGSAVHRATNSGPSSCPGQPQQREWGSSAERAAAPSEAAPLARSREARSQGATESGRPQLPGR